MQRADLAAVVSREVDYRRWKKMDVGGNGGGLAINNKQRAMLPNKSRGEFIRNQRKDSEVSRGPVNLPQDSLNDILLSSF